ncbi:MAG TPA: metal ABC transporter permease [Myxococcaceae bacterium]|nr:metal ABC transporter permease [Myxococcaceae bacterium]
MSLELQILLPAFLACLVLTAFLAYLGLHVLAREVIFVDIALAQIAALGTAVASLRGVEPHTTESYVWSLLFTFAGAALFALTRGLRKRVPQEAFIGITYAVAAATSILVANFLSHGDEEIKEILVGSLLTVSLKDVGVTALIFAALGAFHFAMRHRFIALSFDHDSPEHDTWKGILWDLAFYLTFGVVIASSVQMAGVLLVFSFLIVPAVFSALFSRRLGVRLALAWALGAVVSAGGLWSSFKFDLPTGATVVVTFGVALLLGVLAAVMMARKGKAAEAAVSGSPPAPGS